MKIDDSWFPSPVCSFCSRLRSPLKKRCDAFPRGIPDEIWGGNNQHRETVNGDRGLVFNSVMEPDGRESQQAVVNRELMDDDEVRESLKIQP